MQQYIYHNGAYFLANEAILYSNNRAFRFGDALFETIRVINGKPQLLKDHLGRMTKGLNILKMKTPLNIDVTYLENIIKELVEKNNLYKDARVRFTVYRKEGEYYTPTDNSSNYLIEATQLEEQGYLLNLKGLTIDLFPDFKKPKNLLSSIKSANSIMFVMAGTYKKENNLDECIILNDNLHIVEAISSNIFAVKNGVLYTPPITDGCVDGVMRKRVIEIAQANKIAVYENSIMQNVLLGSDELFLTNSINGISWVVAYKQKRYFNNTSKKLIEMLNNSIDK